MRWWSVATRRVRQSLRHMSGHGPLDLVELFADRPDQCPDAAADGRSRSGEALPPCQASSTTANDDSRASAGPAARPSPGAQIAAEVRAPKQAAATRPTRRRRCGRSWSAVRTSGRSLAPDAVHDSDADPPLQGTGERRFVAAVASMTIKAGARRERSIRARCPWSSLSKRPAAVGAPNRPVHMHLRHIDPDYDWLLGHSLRLPCSSLRAHGAMNRSGPRRPARGRWQCTQARARQARASSGCTVQSEGLLRRSNLTALVGCNIPKRDFRRTGGKLRTAQQAARRDTGHRSRPSIRGGQVRG